MGWKALIVFVLVLAFLSQAYALTVEEKTFSQIGLKELVVSEADKNGCLEFVYAKPANLNTPEHFTFLSLYASFISFPTEKAFASVYLNGSLVKEIKSTEFLEYPLVAGGLGGGGWARVLLEREKLNKENNIKVCLQTSSTVTIATLFPDSKIGTYKTAYFPEGSFTKTVSKNAVVEGDELKVSVVLENRGSAEAEVEIMFDEKELELAQLVRGKTTYSGKIAPGQKVSLEYFVKPYYMPPAYYPPHVGVPMSLPSAKAKYANEFREEAMLESSRPALTVKEQPERISAYILSNTQTAKIGERVEVFVFVKNESDKRIDSVKAYFAQGSIQELKQKMELLEDFALEAGGVKKIRANFAPERAGTLWLGCRADYSDTKQRTAECKPVSITVEEGGLSYYLASALVLVILGVIIYLFLYLK